MSGPPLAEVLAAIPYSGFLGVEAAPEGQAADTVMRFSQKLVGNPMLPALHGGSIAGFMELSAVAVLATRVGRAKPIDVSVAYLRSGKPVDVWARAEIRKVGRRIAYVHVLAWQDDIETPTAEMTAHFLLAHN
jgi:uncharacterized protein (TIGR00369 family)